MYGIQGVGDSFFVIITSGFWFLVLPFYPKRCVVYGSRPGEVSSTQAGVIAVPETMTHEYAGTKKCPACAEIIKLEAVECRFCGETFDPEEVKKHA